MVEIHEEKDENLSSNNHSKKESDSRDASSAQKETPMSSENGNTQTSPNFVDFLKSNKNNLLYFCLRVATIYFSLFYLFPITSPANQKNSYVKAFISAAATNAFRLHQRLSGTSNRFFSTEFLAECLLEDSAHYFFFSLIFLISGQVTMALVPIAAYALLHSMNFSVKAANELGYGSNPIIIKIKTLTQQYTSNLLSMISCAEIALFPILFAMIFVGKANAFIPFIYFRFLSCRYISRRNPYTRQTLGYIKVSMYNFASHANCPGIVRTLIYKSVQLIERFAPQV